MISPYVRRRTLAGELTALRKSAGLTIAQLASTVGESRSNVQRLEGGISRPNEALVIRILEALDVPDDQWDRIHTIAREAAERGWWASYAAEMGERQALTANLEAGAIRIREYQLTYVPGLLQTEDYVRALTEYDDLTFVGHEPSAPAAVIRARAGRQRMLRRPGGATYEVVIDELVVRRPTVPASVHARQLRHLASAGDSIAVHILPIDADIEAYSVPKAAFSLYTYADPADGVVAAVDTVTSDIVLTAAGEVRRYEHLYDRLRKAALSAHDSARLLADAADAMERIAS